MTEQKSPIKSSRIYTDIPIKDAKHFNFEAYTDAISRIIFNKENKTPFTIAINGNWGSGKTTLMKSLREKLKRKTSFENNRKVKTVWFDAWKYSETDSMLAALIVEILQEMGRENQLEKLKAILVGGKQINIIKQFSDLARVLTRGQVEFDKWLDDPEYKKKLSFYDLFQDYIKKILLTFVLEKEKEDYTDREGVLVIFIDDLDRCQPKNIIKILESINLFFDQEGCFFIIGMDISLVSNAINFEYKNFDGFCGNDYIKKMIQLQFNLPALREEDIQEFMENELEIEESIKLYFDIIIKGLEINPREIKRFLNSLDLMRMLGKSIKNLNYDEELLLKWSILNFSSEDFIREVKKNHKLLLIFQSISKKENENDIKEYIEKLDEKNLNLYNKFNGDEKIFGILTEGKEEFDDTNILDYIFLSSVAPKEPDFSFNFGLREMHKATCFDCGQEIEVPFKPHGGKPIYCRECYQKHRLY